MLTASLFTELPSILMKVYAVSRYLLVAWIVGAIVCYWFRGRRWVTPLWAFIAAPAVALLLIVLSAFALTTGLGRVPDDGWLGMALVLPVLIMLPTLLAAMLLLATCPPPRTWDKKLIISSIFAGLASLTLSSVGLSQMRDVFKPPRSVEIVVPDGFRGLIVVRHDPLNGTPPQVVDGVTRYVIPAGGELATTDVGPFYTSHADFATYQSGKPLEDLGDVQRRRKNQPASERKTMKAMHDHAHWQEIETCFMSIGSSNGRILFFVGTPTEYDQLRRTKLDELRVK